MKKFFTRTCAVIAALVVAHSAHAQQSLNGIRLQDANGHVATISAPTGGFTSSYNFRFPASIPPLGSLFYSSDALGQTGWLNAGTNGQVLTISGGIPSWTTLSTGTVTSVGVSVPSFLSVTPATITTNGTFAITLASQGTANQIFASPNGAAGTPTFRSMVLGDLPQIASNTIMGNTTAGAAAPSALTAAQVKTLLNLSGTNSGDLSLSGENYLSITGQSLTVNAVNLSGTNVTGVLPETKGGTNQSTYATGDMLYSSAANTLSKLGGNTSSTKKFLTQTGTGAASAAPGWNTITASDVPVMAASGASHSAGIVPDPGSVAGTSKYLREDGTWAIPGSGSASATTVLYRNAGDALTTTGANSNVLVNAAGLAFPVAAGEVWAFTYNLSANAAANKGIVCALTFPTGGTMECEAEGYSDNGANGHALCSRLTTSGQISGEYLSTQPLSGFIRISGIIDNTSGAAGNLQLQIASAMAADANAKIVYKNSFVTAWKLSSSTTSNTYTSNTTVVVPAGINVIYASGVGGAGGGGGGGGDNGSGGAGSGGGGGAGEYINSAGLAVVPGETLTITIGTGGSGGTFGTSAGASASDGTNGTATTIVGSVSGTIFTANGGSKGTRGHNAVGDPTNSAGGSLGTGGTGSTTANHTDGNAGSAGTAGASNSDKTGGAGGSGPTGVNANTGGTGGTGNGHNSNGTAGTAGTGGYVTISY